MAWAETEKIGCGTSKCDENGKYKQYLVCLYDPPYVSNQQI